MLALAVAWLVLLILELVRGLPDYMQLVGTAIWVVFGIDFAVRLCLSPDRLGYLRGNWLTAVALLVPPMRVLRVLVALRFARVFAAARFLRVVRIGGSLNRGMRSLGRRLKTRGLVYVVFITVMMLLVLSAGIYSYEGPEGSGTLTNYAEAIWTTGIIMTTIGPEEWPVNWEARLLGLTAAIYGFAVFGYLTAAVASFFVGREVRHEERPPGSTRQPRPTDTGAEKGGGGRPEGDVGEPGVVRREVAPTDLEELRGAICLLSEQLARLEIRSQGSDESEAPDADCTHGRIT